MELKSLKSISQKVIFSNIHNTKKLKKDLPIEDYNRLKERSLSTVIREYKEKMKVEGKEYIFFLIFSKNIHIFMMIVGDIVFFVWRRRRTIKTRK